MASRRVTKARRNGHRLSSRAQAVMKAFRQAKSSAPGFLSSCGIFPEVSELASDGLHRIVHEVATRRLQKARYLRAIHRRVQRLSGAHVKQGAAKHLERISSDLTALLAAEATAAYLFGLSVGLSVRSLPERLDR